MLHLPALRGIGLATTLDMLSCTLRTMVSAALALIHSSVCALKWPLWWRTVTSVIEGEGGGHRKMLALCWGLAAVGAGPAYDASMGLICMGWGGLVWALSWPFV